MEFTGIGRLLQVPEASIEQLITPPTRPLITASALDRYLTELEGTLPNWEALHDRPEDEHGTRIFQFNRTRDGVRNGHPLLQQHIAFLWSGLLRQYDEHHQGFRIAVGPILTHTAWGIVRFKPVNIPPETIAIPSSKLLEELRVRVSHDEEIEVIIVYTGFLISQESVMYAFSHDNPDLGMILPFVHIDGVHYIVKDSP
ncbi:MAG: hypothetical protein NPIRA02_23080 [Nitrospirales bacterium]|nr:MAG: hypothetical protein NPIRA02_23080 [Nitrospirales bacterium]